MEEVQSNNNVIQEKTNQIKTDLQSIISDLSAENEDKTSERLEKIESNVKEIENKQAKIWSKIKEHDNELDRFKWKPPPATSKPRIQFSYNLTEVGKLFNQSLSSVSPHHTVEGI